MSYLGKKGYTLFKKDYNDILANQKFYYTCINKYLPLMYIAF